MTSLDSPMEVFTTAEVRSPIRRVHIQDDDTLYVLGSQNVHINLKPSFFYFS
jgi:hypothetical protein